MQPISKQKVKGLKRAKSFIKHFSKSVEHVKEWSNNPIQVAKILKISCLLFVGYHNIKATEFPDTNLKNFSAQSGKLYTRILMTLYVEGKAARTKTLQFTGIGNNQMHLIEELIKHGYVEQVVTRRLRHTYLNKPINEDQKEIELTTKGYDLLMQIFKSIINDELL